MADDELVDPTDDEIEAAVVANQSEGSMSDQVTERSGYTSVPSIDAAEALARLWNIYENLFGLPPDEDTGEYPNGESEYSQFTREQLVRMVEHSRDRIGMILRGESEL